MLGVTIALAVTGQYLLIRRCPCFRRKYWYYYNCIISVGTNANAKAAAAHALVSHWNTTNGDNFSMVCWIYRPLFW